MIELDHLSVSGRDEQTAFELESITRMMTAALLIEIIGRGEIAIEDHLATLPP